MITVIAYVLGAAGMAGVWLLPSHLWSLVVLRQIRRPLPHAVRGLLIALFAGLPIAASIFVGAAAMPRVFACLADMRCGPNRAGGLLNLAAFGASVLVAEAAWQIAAFLCARSQRRQPNSRSQQTALRTADEPSQ